MTKDNSGHIYLEPSDGMIWTNGQEFAREAHLGSGDSEENWYKITKEEYESLL